MKSRCHRAFLPLSHAHKAHTHTHTHILSFSFLLTVVCVCLCTVGSILRRRANRSSDLPPQSAFASIPPLLDMHGQNGVEGVSTTQVFALVFVFFVGLLFGGILF